MNACVVNNPAYIMLHGYICSKESNMYLLHGYIQHTFVPWKLIRINTFTRILYLRTKSTSRTRRTQIFLFWSFHVVIGPSRHWGKYLFVTSCQAEAPKMHLKHAESNRHLILGYTYGEEFKYHLFHGCLYDKETNAHLLQRQVYMIQRTST